MHDRVTIHIEPEQELVDCDEIGCGVWLKGEECTIDFNGDRLRAWTAPDDEETSLEISVLAATVKRAPQPDGTGRWTIQFGMATKEEALPLARALLGDRYQIADTRSEAVHIRRDPIDDEIS